MVFYAVIATVFDCALSPKDVRTLICFLWIPVSTVDVAAVTPNGIKTISANGWSTFLINGKPVYSNEARNLPSNPPDCTILDSWIFDNSVLAGTLFAKFLPKF